MTTEPDGTSRLDIEFPLKTRGRGGAEPERLDGVSDVAMERLATVPAPIPFLIGRLLSARGPFGLDVEMKSEQRVVGTWSIEVNPRGMGDVYVSQAKAHLYVCASACGDLRATGAFLVVRQWWVRVSDPVQVDQLYESLGVAALERLGALVAGAGDDADGRPECVLFLIDGRRQERKLFSLDRLQARLLEELEGRHAIAEVDLSVAHGRGTGTRPNTALTSTLPALLQPGDSGLGDGDSQPADMRSSGRSLVGEVFVREMVSTENLRWNRRASDRESAMLRQEDPPPSAEMPSRPRNPGPA